MTADNEIINRVTNSGLVTINLEELYPEAKRMKVAMDDFLYEGLILREKDFREKLKATNWSDYKDCYVAVIPATEAIVPTWAYMLLATQLQSVARKVVFGSLDELENSLFIDILSLLDVEQYRNQRVVVKGCSDKPVPTAAYMELINRLMPVVQSIMYGEPCSTVPVFKRKTQ